MSKVKELYIALRDDPDLDIPEGETRESAAWNETSQRMRQHKTNSKALALAAESPVEKLLNFTSNPEFLPPPSLATLLKEEDETSEEAQERIKAQPYGAFQSKAAMNRKLQDMTGGKFTKTELNKFVNDLNPAQRNNLGNNINKYFNPANDDDAFDIHGNMTDWAFSLPKDDINNLFNHLSDNKQPFTVDAGVAGKELRDKGYVDKGIRASGGKYPLSLQGAAHLIQAGMNLGTSSKNPYHISATKFNKNSEDLSNEDNWIGPEQVEQPVTTEDKQNDLANRLVQEGIVPDKKKARDLVNNISDDDTNFDDLEDNLYKYHEKMGGHPIEGRLNAHAKNITGNTTNTVTGHVPAGKPDPSTDTPEEVSEPEAFKPIKIYDYGNFTADDFDSDGKLKPAIFEEDGDLEFLSDNEKKYLQNITFQSGQDYEAGKNIPTPKVETQESTEPKTDTKVSKPKSTKAKSSETTSGKKSEAVEEEGESFKDRLVAHAREQEENLRNAYSPENPDDLSDAQLEAKKHLQDVVGSAIMSGDDDRILSAMQNHFDEHGGAAYPIASKHKDAKEFLGNIMRGETEPASQTDTPAEKVQQPVSEDEQTDTDDASEEDDDEDDDDDAGVDSDIDARDAADDQKSQIDKYIEQAKKAGLFEHMYEQAHGKEDDPDRSPFADTPEEFEDKLRKKFEKNPDKLKDNFHAEHGKMKKFQAKVQADADKKDEKEEAKQTKDDRKQTQERAREDGEKISAAEAESINRKTTDPDEAYELHQNANTIPEHVDSMEKIRDKMFGDQRDANKHGQESTKMARDLIAHYQEHNEHMTKESKDKLFKHLSALQNPYHENHKKEMNPPKARAGENPHAHIDTAHRDVYESKQAGHKHDSEEAQRMYRRTDEKLDQRSRNFHSTHVEHQDDAEQSKEQKRDESHRIFGEGDSTKWGHFDASGNMIGRKKYDHEKKDHVPEKLAADGSDDHIKRGDTGATKSPFKEHHHLNLNENQQGLLDNLKEAHKKHGESEDPTNQKRYQTRIDGLKSHLKDAGLHEHDYMHREPEPLPDDATDQEREDDKLQQYKHQREGHQAPKHGPPDPEVAKKKTADGWEWHEGTRTWGLKENHDKWRESNGASSGMLGSGSSMNLFEEDGVTQAQGHFYFSPNGLQHVNTDSQVPSSTSSGIQAQKLGSSAHIKNTAAKLDNLGAGEHGIQIDHRLVSEQSGIHFGQSETKGASPGGLPSQSGQIGRQSNKVDAIARNAAKTVGGSLGQLGLGALETFGGKAGAALAGGIEQAAPKIGEAGGKLAGKFGIKNPFDQKSLDELTAVELLQLHVVMQKAKNKEREKEETIV